MLENYRISPEVEKQVANAKKNIEYHFIFHIHQIVISSVTDFPLMVEMTHR